jgi:hypothetical protein
MLLVRAAVSARALERLGQQRVRQRLAGDPLGVQRVGLAALAPPISARRAVRAHIAHVMTPPAQEHGRVAPPAGGVLHPPAGDLPKLARPRLKRPMTAAGHLEVLRRHDPTAGIHDRRGQRLLVRVDPDDIAGMIRRNQHTRRPRPPPVTNSTTHCDLPALWFLADRPTTSRWAPPHRGRTLLSGQADPRRQEPRPTLRPEDTPQGSQSLSESDLGSAFDPTRTVAHAGTEDSTPGSLW